MSNRTITTGDGSVLRILRYGDTPKMKGKFIQILKPRPFRYEEDFKQFCEIVKQYVAISEIKENLDQIFLCLIDDRTLLAKLTSEKFEVGSDKDLEKLCESALKMYYLSSNELNLISNLMNIRQGKLENIDDFEYKLSLAAARIEGSEKIKLTAFINGLKNSANYSNQKFERIVKQKI